MTNIIKKLAVAILSMTVVAGVFAPFATSLAATFNTVPGDYAVLQVSNYTQHPGSNTSWAQSVSANAGEVISFVVYYYNTATDTANATRVRVQLPTGSFTSTTITGDVQATNATLVAGTVSVNLTSAQSLSYIPGSVKWYPNQSVTAQALPNGQNGSEIISANGLSLGDIASQGWGTVVFRAQVSNPGSGGGTSIGSAPLVSTNSAYSISQNSATVQSSVNPQNSATNAWFEYGTSQSFGNTSGYQSVGSGNSATNVTSYLSNLSANTTYYYRAVAQNSYGTTYGSVMSFSTQSSNYGGNYGSAPGVYTNTATYNGNNAMTLGGSVNPNNNYTNAWFEYGLTNSLGYTTGYQSVGSGNQSSSIITTVSNLASNTTYYYRVVAQNSYGTTYGSIVTFTTSGSTFPGSGIAPYVTTKTADSIFRNSALINGNINANGSLTTAWFDWGETAAMGNRTMIQPMGQTNSVNALSAVLTGLRSGTTYYYRAVAQNAYGTTYGNVLTFTTIANQVIPVVVTTPTEPRVIVQQVSSGTAIAGPTVILIPSIDNKSPRKGDMIEYSIMYRNETSRPITNSTLKVVLPSEVKYDRATLQPSTINGQELTFDLGTIGARSQGTITITVKVDDVDADSALVFSSTLNYTDYRRAFQATTAYLTVMTSGGTAGLASLTSVLGSFFTNWFIDLILGLLIGFGIYHFFVRQKEEEAVLIK